MKSVLVPRRQQGIGLLTVLLLVAVMSMLVIAVLDDIRFGLRRAGNAQSVAQAQWYALGAEALALGRIEQLARSTPGRTTLAGDWNGRAFVFPIEEASEVPGTISARVSDGTTCFNLNSVVEGAGEQWRRREEGVRQFVALQRALDIDEATARALADALVDWIDADQQPGALGAEDPAYLDRAPGHRTAATLLDETSELRAVQGVDPALYTRLRPHVCALPTADLSPLNVNTLAPADAPLLQMLAGDALDSAAARAIIESRPASGWRSFAEFWGQPALAGLSLPDPVPGQVQLDTRYFDLHAEVEYGDAQVELSGLLELDGDGHARVVARRWTPEE